MRISVVVSVYGRPQELELVLWGYAAQQDRDFQLVIADDGSGPEIVEVAERVARAAGLRLLHVWHADRGFRKTEILNRAIQAASGDYLVFTDGDCIPRNDLVAIHRRLAEPGRYLAGGYLKLPAEVSRSITVEDVRDGRVSDVAWLRSRGWRPGRRALRLTPSPLLGRLFDGVTPTSAHFHGNNASVHREALEAVNGFEGKMGYGGLDRALGYRLENHGVRGRQIRHRAVCLHLHHDRPYRTDEGMRRNRALLDRIRRERLIRAERGLAELSPDPTLRVTPIGTHE